MALPYSQSRELHLKLVVYGPASAGKTSTLNYLYRALRSDLRGQLVAVNTGTDRTIFFDFYPSPPARLVGLGLHIQIYTVTGSIQNDATRRALFAGADGVLFIADSQRGREQDNIRALEELRMCLLDLNLSLDQVPLVLAWNKRDLPNALSVGELEVGLNITQAPSFATVAPLGQGLFEAFRALCSKALDSTLRRRPEVLNAGLKLDPTRSSDVITGRRVLATQDTQRALVVLSTRYPADALSLEAVAARGYSQTSAEVRAENAAAINSAAAQASAGGSMPSSSHAAGREGHTSVRTEPSLPGHYMAARHEPDREAGERGPAAASVPSREEAPSRAAVSHNRPVADNSPAADGADPVSRPSQHRPARPSNPNLGAVIAQAQAQQGGDGTDLNTGSAVSGARSGRSLPGGRVPGAGSNPAVAPVRDVWLSQLLPPGALRSQLQDVERQTTSGQWSAAVRRAANIFYALTAAEATREPDEGPAWRVLVLGLPVDRYLRFRQAVQDAEAGKSTQEDALFALFFLLDAALRKETWLPRSA